MLPAKDKASRRSYLDAMLSNLMGPQAVLAFTIIAAILLFIFFFGRSPPA